MASSTTRRAFLTTSSTAALLVAARGARAADRIRYGGDLAFAPFESPDPHGRPHGFQIDLLDALGREIDATFEVTLQPWANTVRDFRQGGVDVIAMVDTADRRQWARFARGHATPALGVYHPATRTPPQAFHDLLALRVAVLDTDVMRDTLAAWPGRAPERILPVADAPAALEAVRRLDADVALLPRAYADALIAGDAARGLARSHLNLGLQTYAFAVAPHAEALQQRLQHGLDRLEADGRLELLRMRWLSSHQDLAERDRLEQGLSRQRTWTWELAAGSAAGLLLMAVGIRRRGRRVAIELARRRDAEAALARAEELLERTFVLNPDPMLIVERGSRIVRDANAALASLLGITTDALVGRALAELAAHVDAQALDELVRSFDSEGALDAVPLQLKKIDGTVRDCLLSATAMTVEGEVQVFCYLRDITERLAADAALREGYDALVADLARARGERDAAREASVRAEGALHEYTRSVAHDLKTPLQAVLGLADLIRHRLQAGRVQEAIEFSEHIDRAALRMNATIDALTRLARVSDRPLQRRPVDMTALARQTWAIVSDARPHQKVECRIDPLPQAMADPDLVAQVWQNLLDNAAKYSARAANARIAVDGHRDAQGQWYRIADNGIGFDTRDAKSLFKPFQRMHRHGDFEGTGVGLSLVRRIVDHHQGDVRIRSTPGVGTVVEFRVDPPPSP
ncbi:MAG: ATP-binding protein [Lautropia sp.]